MSEFILEWCREEIRGVAAVAGHSPEVKTVGTWSTVEHNDLQVPPSQVAEGLKNWLQEEGIAASKVTVVLPREIVVQRRLKLPDAPADELPDLVRLQFATRSAGPAEASALDFLVVPSPNGEEGIDVTTISLDRDRLNRIVSICTLAGLAVAQVTISPLTTANLVRSQAARDLGQSGADLLVYQQGARIELSVLEHGSLVFSHAVKLLDLPTAERLKPLKTELSRCLVALEQQHPNVGVKRCYYLSGDPENDVIELLLERFSNQLQQIDSARLVKNSQACGYESLIGAAIPERDQLHLDLAHPRQRREVRDRRKLYIGAGAVAVGILVLLGLSSFYSQKATLEQSIQRLQGEVATQQAMLKRGEPRAEAHDRVAQWKAGDTDLITLWSELQKYLPGTDQVYFVELRITPTNGDALARMIGQGRALSRSDVDSLYQRLSDHGFRVRPTTPIENKVDPAYPWQFELDVELLRSESPSSESLSVRTNS